MMLEDFITYDGRCGSCKFWGFRHWCPKSGTFPDAEETCNHYEMKRGE
jgi:hypothetical protein